MLEQWQDHRSGIGVCLRSGVPSSRPVILKVLSQARECIEKILDIGKYFSGYATLFLQGLFEL